jgi:hypothetical protein
LTLKNYKAYCKVVSKIEKAFAFSNQKTFVQRMDSPLDDKKAWLNSIAQAVTGKTLEAFTDEDEIMLYEKFKSTIFELDSLTKISKEILMKQTKKLLELRLILFLAPSIQKL